MRLSSIFPQDHIRQLAAALTIAAAFLFPPDAANAGDAGLMAAAPAPVPAPAIELAGMDGTAFSLAARRGKFTLVNFWALWCAPCKQEMPALAELRSRMAGPGFQPDFEIVTVNLGDRPGNIARFSKQVALGNLPILLDRDGAAGRNWHVQGLPATFLVAPDGTISHVALGAREWSGDFARRWLAGVIGRTGN
jgi:thiol-disulfide isomerase/thioredoxin